MTFATGNRWLLKEVISRYPNNLHQKIVGRTCELVSFVEHEFGWFNAIMDDGPHSICTAIVHDVTENDDGSITVSTENSCYTFIPVCDPMLLDSVERMCAPCR